MNQIQFITEDISFSLKDKTKTRSWLKDTAKQENHKLISLTYIFCSDEYLLNINKEYLNHDYYTDIITFDNSTEPAEIMGDIFISVDRVQENAEHYGQPFQTELNRVLVHGLLHLCGYTDKQDAEQAVMRQKEDTYISLR